LALGYPHPDYLLPYLTAEQLTEWEAYSIIEPFGQPHEDDMLVGQTAGLANAVGMSKKKDNTAFKAEDFYRKPEDTLEKMYGDKYRQSADDMERLLKSIAIEKEE